MRTILYIYKDTKITRTATMAFLLLLHEKMRLQRKVNKLTLQEARLSSRKERITKNISRVQKMYSSKMSNLEKQAQMFQSQFSVWAQNASGLGTNGLNPYNFQGVGGTSAFITKGLSEWCNKAKEFQTKDKEGNDTGELIFTGGATPEGILQAYQNGTLVQNKNDKGEIDKDNPWTDGVNNYTAAQYQAMQAGISTVQQMQSYRQMQVQQMSSQYQSNVSIWLDAKKAQLEAEQDAALAPLEEQETDIDLDKETCETLLADARARLDGIKQACSEGIKDSAPTFGLG